MNTEATNGLIVQIEQKQLLLTPLWPIRFEQVLNCKLWFAPSRYYKLALWLMVQTGWSWG